MPRRTPGVFFRRDRNKWYARVKTPDGREVWRACGGRQEALEVAAALQHESARVRLGLPVAPKGTRTVFRTVVPEFLKWSQSNKRSWRRDRLSLSHLVRYFGDKVLADISPRDVEAYRAWRRTQRTVKGTPPSNPTLNREVRCLTRMLRWCVDRGLLPASPLQGLRLPPEAPPRVPTLDLDTEARILAALPLWARLPVTLALRTGARIGEICAARWRHIDLDAATWTIPNTKNLSPRIVPLPSDVVELLRPLRGVPDAPVVLCEGRSPLPSSVSHAFRKAARKVGRPDLRFHDLRHVFASRMLAAGASLVEIAAVLGHRTLAMSARYSHASAERLRALVAAIPVTPAPASSASVRTMRPR